MNAKPNPPENSGEPRRATLKVVAVGGAAGKVAARLSAAWPHGGILAVDSDVNALGALGALAGVEKFQLGAQTLRGLSAGGDPECAAEAAETDAGALENFCRDTDVVLLVAGLGRGLGSGVAPVVARMAKQAGALVLAFGILPFGLEGRRRGEQAEDALAALKSAADGVICLPNSKLAALVGANASLVETFEHSNELLCSGLRAIARLAFARGLIDVDFAQLCAAIRDRHAECVFATAEAAGENRAKAVMENLIASPLLGGATLDSASSVLVSIVGGPELGLADIGALMEEINTRSGAAPVVMGAAVDAGFARRISVTLIVAQPTGDREEVSKRFTPPVATSKPAEDAPTEASSFESGYLNRPETKRPRNRLRPPPPEQVSPPGGKAAPRPRRKSGPKLQQGQLPLDVVSRGRFEKSEPTIHHGEDLDVPTYIRRGMALN
ncbi:MAG: hypothetical protein HY301_18590 [Verrucomicrobia bacterium]|nr:hypothetical protein [Verrucomicrobiota bacterium]